MTGQMVSVDLRQGAVIRKALAQYRVGVDELTRDSQPSRPLLDLLQATYVDSRALGSWLARAFAGPR